MPLDTLPIDPPEAARTRREVPPPDPRQAELREVLEQLAAQIGAMRDRMGSRRAVLERHRQVLAGVAQRNDSALAGIYLVERCTLLTAEYLAQFLRVEGLVAQLAARQWSLRSRLDLGDVTVAEQDIRELVQQVSELDLGLFDILMRDMAITQLQLIHRAVVVDEHVQSPAEAAQGSVCAAPGAAGPSAPEADHVRWEPPSREALLYSDAQTLLQHTGRYQHTLMQQLQWLVRMRDQAQEGGRAPDPVLQERIQGTLLALDGFPDMLQQMDGLLRDIRAVQVQPRSTWQDPAPVLGLEARFRALVLRSGQHLLASPLTANLEYLTAAAQAPGAVGGLPAPGGAGDHAGAGGGPAGALAHPMGAPEGVERLRAGYYADWETLARMYRHGEPLDGNRHQRRYRFADGYVDIAAHEPVLTTSDASNWAVAGTFFTSLLSGTGFVGAPLVTRVVDRLRPYDSLWQGYTARFYAADGASAPWGTRYFYGWQRSDNIARPVLAPDQAGDQDLPDLADRMQGVDWWRWSSGGAPYRPPALAPAQASACQSAQWLVQCMGQWVDARQARFASAAAPQQAGSACPQPVISVVHG